MGNIVDVTEQKRAEEQLRKINEELKNFIHMVSHDLKTPLSSIAGYLDAIGDGLAERPSDLGKYLAIIRDKTGVLEGRIRQHHIAVQLAADAQGQFSLGGVAFPAGVVNVINPAQIGSRQWISTDCGTEPGRTVNTMRASR